jgi:Fungal specific transcription factor domain
MSFAMSLHIELPASAQVPVGIREGRRQLFWACYILDRFFSCGSKRPSLISDECVGIRLPFARDPSGAVREGSHFSGTSTQQYMRGGLSVLGASGMLIEITRILGMTNRYLAAGGPKSDSRFPWHQQSNLSKIRQELEFWAAEAQDTFQSLDILFAQQESTILALSKLVYHLIHCLLYRPFIPVDLFELSASGQDQSWRIEATNLCFFHANTITELIDIWKTGTSNDVPAFAAYCLNIAGTVHVHGAHYREGNSEVFSMSKEFLTLELRHLTEMKWTCESLQHQLDHLQAVYNAHSELVKSAAGRPSPTIFNYDDFLDRYNGGVVDGAYLPLNSDVFGQRLVLLSHITTNILT